MIPNDLAASLRLLTESTVNPVSAIRGLATGLPELDVGQRFTARIESPLPDGSYRALVAGRSLTLALPQAARAGDQLELVVAARTPRLIVAEQVARNDASQASSAPATLSRAGQFLGTLLAEAAVPVQAGSISGTHPLVASPTTQAALLAPALRQAIAGSGLFYEAHQAQWLAGRYPAAALAREPQARFGRPANTTGAPPSVDSQGAPRTETMLPPAAAETSSRTAPTSALPVELQALVHEQLNAASTGQIVWRGEIWPGLVLEWEIADEDAHPSGGGSDEDEATAPAWRTALRLNLPQLGEVRVALALDPAKVSAGITAPESSLAPLRAGLGELVAAFRSAGLPPLNAGVTADEEAMQGSRP